AVLRLLDEDDPVAAELLERAVFHCVPVVNPDGAARGNHRTNAAGRDLNRAWLSPTPEDSPEVLAVRGALLDGGVDLFLDVHGDETIPYVFAAGCEGNPGYSPRLQELERLFTESLCRRHDGFQRRAGYDPDEPGQADLSVAASYVGERFGCLSMTLEMPFTDDADDPEDEGWSPERSRRFGEATLESVLDCLDELR
ncbi:MAG: carboxypeptidase family protein, partial [Polyangiaceae bacterium]|nr:carboxypeptidase family protein [Polyangiaceae bacterium]